MYARAHCVYVQVFSQNTHSRVTLPTEFVMDEELLGTEFRLEIAADVDLTWALYGCKEGALTSYVTQFFVCKPKHDTVVTNNSHPWQYVVCTFSSSFASCCRLCWGL